MFTECCDRHGRHPPRSRFYARERSASHKSQLRRRPSGTDHGVATGGSSRLSGARGDRRSRRSGARSTCSTSTSTASRRSNESTATRLAIRILRPRGDRMRRLATRGDLVGRHGATSSRFSPGRRERGGRAQGEPAVSAAIERISPGPGARSHAERQRRNSHAYPRRRGPEDAHEWATGARRVRRPGGVARTVGPRRLPSSTGLPELRPTPLPDEGRRRCLGQRPWRESQVAMAGLLPARPSSRTAWCAIASPARYRGPDWASSNQPSCDRGILVAARSVTRAASGAAGVPGGCSGSARPAAGCAPASPWAAGLLTRRIQWRIDRAGRWAAPACLVLAW